MPDAGGSSPSAPTAAPRIVASAGRRPRRPAGRRATPPVAAVLGRGRFPVAQPPPAVQRSAGEAHRTAHAGALDAAVAQRVLVEVLLVVVLRVPERAGIHDLGRDRPVAGRNQLLLVGVAGPDRPRALLCVEGLDARPVLGTDVVALAHPLRGVVALPEAHQ